MAEKTRDPQISAIEAIYSALKALDPASRRKVLASVSALINVGEIPVTEPRRQLGDQDARKSDRPPNGGSSRPVSLVELVQEKKPGTNSQRIATFAYYREKHESLPRFQRDDLESYFAKAKEPPASNYHRDFVEAVKKGWIHEDGAESYLTSKGLEAVESGFEGERKRTRGKKPGAAKGRTRKNPEKKRAARRQ